MFVNFLKFTPKCHTGNKWNNASLLMGCSTSINSQFCKLSSTGDDCSPLTSTWTEPGFQLCICLLFSRWLCAPSTFIAQCSPCFFLSNLNSFIIYSNRQTHSTSQHMGSTFKIRANQRFWGRVDFIREGDYHLPNLQLQNRHMQHRRKGLQAS